MGDDGARGKDWLRAIISMLNEPNPFLCHPAVLGSRNFATCFLLPLFHCQFDIVKYEDIILIIPCRRRRDIGLSMSVLPSEAITK